MKDGTFTMDIQGMRDRARKHIEQGAMTSGYKAKSDIVIRLLNNALATELVCVLRYKRHYYMAKGINSDSVKTSFSSMHRMNRVMRTVWLNVSFSSVANRISLPTEFLIGATPNMPRGSLWKR